MCDCYNTLQWSQGRSGSHQGESLPQEAPLKQAAAPLTLAAAPWNSSGTYSQYKGTATRWNAASKGFVTAETRTADPSHNKSDPHTSIDKIWGRTFKEAQR